MNSTNPSSSVRWEQRAARLVVAVVLGVLCLLPHLVRLRFPSLWYDDLLRVEQLQTRPVAATLGYTLSGHMALFFNAYTWVAWQFTGGRLVHAPLVFTLASYVPFLMTLGLLHRVAVRELRSGAAGWVAVAVFSLSSAHAETIHWYSGSSFMWAAVWVLATWLAAGSAATAGDGSRASWAVAALAAWLAPCCSLVGLAAGPLGAIRVACEVRPGRAWLKAALPLTGTFLYLIMYLFIAPQDGQGGRSSYEFGLPLWDAVQRAFTLVLLPGLIGWSYQELPAWVTLAVSGLVLVGGLGWAARSPFRGVILGGFALIVVGYVASFGARVAGWGPDVVRVERYHMLPQLGLSLLLAAAARPILARCAAVPRLVPLVLLALVSVLCWAHAPGIVRRARVYDFPTQEETLAAIDRLATICRAEGVSRAQAIRTFGKFRPKWACGPPNSPGVSPLRMLPETAAHPRVADADVQATVWAALTPSDRLTLSAGLIASRWLLPLEELGEAETLAVGRLVGGMRVMPKGDDRYQTNWGLGYLEYDLTGPAGSAPQPAPRFLYVPGTLPGNVGEVWWSRGDGDGAGDGWHEGRSVVWFTDPKTMQPQALRVDQFPQGDWAGVRRIRLVFRMPGLASVGAPRLLR